LCILDILVHEWIRILLFSSVTYKMSTKNLAYYPYFLKVQLHYSAKIKSHKKVTNSEKKTVGIKVFLLFLVEDGRIRIR